LPRADSVDGLSAGAISMVAALAINVLRLGAEAAKVIGVEQPPPKK
jgi:hypothetical protein